MRRLVYCLAVLLLAGCLRVAAPTAKTVPPPTVIQTGAPQVQPQGPPGDGTAPKKTPAQTGIREVIERPQVMQELQQIGILYMAWTLEAGGRRTAADFQKSLQKDAASIYQAVAQGYYTINPKLTTPGATVVAYETQPVGGRGHYAVFKGGSVQSLTPAQLAGELAK